MSLSPKSDAEKAFDWLDKNNGHELAHCGGWDDDDDIEWRVYRISGGKNDREWHVVGRGETSLAAILDAMERKGKRYEGI